MVKFWSWIFNAMQKQGISFGLLCVAVWWFQNENIELHQKIDVCNRDIIQIYQDQNQKIIEVLDRNSVALEEIGRYLNTKDK